MSNQALHVPADDGLGKRIMRARRRAGLSREVTAGLCGRSEEWLRKIERGQRGTTMRNISRLAQVLRVADLVDLLGSQIPAGLYTRPQHDAIDQLRLALVDYQPTDEPAPNAAELRQQVDAAWHRHSDSPRNRTITASVVPGLLAEARRAARAASTPEERRDALAVLSTAYLLAQLYLAYQGLPEVISVASDRAAMVAWESNDPETISQAAWLRSFLARDLGEISAAHQIAADARHRLELDDATPRQRSMMWLSTALTHSRDGAAAEAWAAWDRAVELDGRDYPLALYSSQPTSVALILDIELGRVKSAMNRAQRVDLSTYPTVTKRAGALLGAARAHALAEEWAGVLHLLRAAVNQSPDQVTYSQCGTRLVVDLVQHGGPLLERDSRQLASDLGIAA